MAAMIEGAVLAIVVVFLFLRDWRATFISALAIPLSAIPTFWFMDLLGFTLNEMTLLALSLVAGVLVDDAIVEIENIVRHMRMGKSAYQASIDAADEIGLAGVATTFSIVAVFLPVGQKPGISGQFFNNFGLTVVAAVLTSLAVARMITPMIAAYFLHAKGEAAHGEGWLMDRYMGVLNWTLHSDKSIAYRAGLQPAPGRRWYYLVETVLWVLAVAAVVMAWRLSGSLIPEDTLPGWAALLVQLVAAIAAGLLVRLLVPVIAGAFGGGFADWHAFFMGRVRARIRDHRFFMFGAGIAALGLTVALLMLLPQQFQPLTDSDSSRVNIEMIPGTTIEQTEVVADRVTSLLEEQPEVDRVMERVREGGATLFVMLSADRESSSIEFERRVAKDFQDIPDARVTFASQSGGGGTGRDISVMLTGSDPELLNNPAQTLVEQMKDVQGIVAPRIAADLQRPELVIIPRLDLAAQLGVTTSALSQAIRIATMGEIDQSAA